MDKTALSLFEDFKKDVINMINQNPECSNKQNENQWYECVYNICLQIMNKSLEVSRNYEPEIDEQHPVYKAWIEMIDKLMQQLRNGTIYLDINQPAFASNTITLLYKIS